jgi:protein O-GlcNAc transferase
LKARGLDDAFVANRIVESFAARGIAADRLDLRGRIEDPRGHLALYGEIDVALDTFPYHGTTTTCEALSMGVPVVSLSGVTHRSRVAASLSADEAGVLMAEDLQGFVRRAVDAIATRPSFELHRPTRAGDFAVRFEAALHEAAE